MGTNDVLAQLIEMSHRLGDPAMDSTILGEGNTSARVDDETFWVKASGAELGSLDESGLVQVSFERALAMLDAGDLSDDEVKQGLVEAKVDGTPTPRPSVETVLHALALQLPGVNFIGHTHPTFVNMILCSERAEEAIAGRLFPDEIVYCGVAPVWIPWTDPGMPLARRVRQGIEDYRAEYDLVPKVLLMQNHGLIALGKSPTEVENITRMYVKTARVIVGSYALGGPHFLSQRAVDRIHTRPDEEYRRKEWGSE
jgi:rhamnose utilization protein RhaD (predicted bifunctional aldolase and dehydrogenase)